MLLSLEISFALATIAAVRGGGHDDHRLTRHSNRPDHKNSIFASKSRSAARCNSLSRSRSEFLWSVGALAFAAVGRRTKLAPLFSETTQGKCGEHEGARSRWQESIVLPCLGSMQRSC